MHSFSQFIEVGDFVWSTILDVYPILMVNELVKILYISIVFHNLYLKSRYH